MYTWDLVFYWSTLSAREVTIFTDLPNASGFGWLVFSSKLASYYFVILILASESE